MEKKKEEKKKEEKKKEEEIKICVAGDSKTGKTKFIKRITNDQFDNSYKQTRVSEFGFKAVVRKGIVYKVQLWDLPGQDINANQAKLFSKDADGLIFVADSTNKDTLEK